MDSDGDTSSPPPEPVLHSAIPIACDNSLTFLGWRSRQQVFRCLSSSFGRPFLLTVQFPFRPFTPYRDMLFSVSYACQSLSSNLLSTASFLAIDLFFIFPRFFFVCVFAKTPFLSLFFIPEDVSVMFDGPVLSSLFLAPTLTLLIFPPDTTIPIPVFPLFRLFFSSIYSLFSLGISHFFWRSMNRAKCLLPRLLDAPLFSKVVQALFWLPLFVLEQALGYSFFTLVPLAWFTEPPTVQSTMIKVFLERIGLVLYDVSVFVPAFSSE